jgi:hypothetical protein
LQQKGADCQTTQRKRTNDCKAFIHASEDCIHDNGMKGYKFEQLMGNAYKILCESQLREEETAYNLLVCTSRISSIDPMVNEVPGHNVPVPFYPRNGKDMLLHFKVNISPAVSRYCGIRATTPIGTGQNKTVYTVAIDAMYRERMGKLFAYWPCYKYLHNQEKWKKFLANEESPGQQRRPGRPVGTKAASATKGEMVTIEKIVAKETKALASALGKRRADESESKSSFYNTISVAVKETMEMFLMSKIIIIDRGVDDDSFDMVDVFVVYDQWDRDRRRTFTSEGSAEETGIFHD